MSGQPAVYRRSVYPQKKEAKPKESKPVVATRSDFVQTDKIELATYSYLCRKHVLYIYMPDGSHAAVWLTEKKSAFIGTMPCKILNLPLLCTWLANGGIPNVWTKERVNSNE